MLRNPESLGQSDQYGHAPESSDTRLFIPSKEQAGLFGDELLPFSHRIPEALPETLSLQLEAVEDDKEGNVQQGEFERHDLSELNTVVQQRKIYEDIDILANNIKEEGLLIHPLLVARYTSEEQAHAYLVAAYGTVGKKIPSHETAHVHLYSRLDRPRFYPFSLLILQTCEARPQPIQRRHPIV